MAATCIAIWRPNVARGVDVALGFERHQHADLAQALGDLVVDVARDHALPDVELGHPAQVHVLADRGDEALELVGDGLAGAGEMGGLKTFERPVGVEGDLGGLARLNAWKASLRATKSVSEFTSTMAA